MEPSLAWNRPCTLTDVAPIDAMLSSGCSEGPLTSASLGGLSLLSEQCVSPVNWILVVRGDLSCLHAFFIVLRATREPSITPYAVPLVMLEELPEAEKIMTF